MFRSWKEAAEEALPHVLWTTSRSRFATARCVQGAAHGRIGGGIGFVEARPCGERWGFDPRFSPGVDVSRGSEHVNLPAGCSEECLDARFQMK
jgi:hypothetical protein